MADLSSNGMRLMRPGGWRRSVFTESPKRSDAYSKRLFNASLEDVIIAYSVFSVIELSL